MRGATLMTQCYKDIGTAFANRRHCSNVLSSFQAIFVPFIILVPVRLSDGVSPNQGRVEVFVEGTWQSTCDFWWTIAEATVVCRMLGFSLASGVTYKSAFGNGSAPMWLHEFDCDGSENQLPECPMDTRFSTATLRYFCPGHNKEAGVVCGTPNGKRLLFRHGFSPFSFTSLKMHMATYPLVQTGIY